MFKLSIDKIKIEQSPIPDDVERKDLLLQEFKKEEVTTLYESIQISNIKLNIKEEIIENSEDIQQYSITCSQSSILSSVKVFNPDEITKTISESNNSSLTIKYGEVEGEKVSSPNIESIKMMHKCLDDKCVCYIEKSSSCKKSRKIMYQCANKYKSVVLVHHRTHSKEKKFHCTECRFITNYKSVLDVHLRTHTGEKPYQCPHCPYSATANCGLRRDLLIHTGARPYHCPHCTYTAKAKSTFHEHIRTHTGERPYPCTLCTHAAKTKYALTKHLQSHRRKKPYDFTPYLNKEEAILP